MPTFAQFIAFAQQAGQYLRAVQMQTRVANLIDGVVEHDITAGDTTLTSTSTELQYSTIKLTGTPAGALNYKFPDGYTGKRTIINTCGQTATVKTVSGTGVPIDDGIAMAIFSDGTDVLALGFPASALPTGIDATNIADGSVDNTEFQRLNGLLSAIQEVGNLSSDVAGDTGSIIKYPSIAALEAYVAAMVAGLLDLKGGTDASGNPNYPAASKGDAYYITVAGKIGGAAGKSVDVSDLVVASADNAGGTEASVGTSWFVLEHNLAGALLAANNLSDLANAATARTNLGLGNVANVDTTNAANISSGILPISRLDTVTRTRTINFVIDGGGAVIATGVKGDIIVDATCTIISVTVLADQSGSIVVDIWRDTYGNFPPTNADSICGGAKPTISSATKSQDATLTGWTTNIPASEVLRFNVDSCTGIQRATVSLKVAV